MADDHQERDIANPSAVANLTAELARINPAADILDIQGVDTFRQLLGNPWLS